MIPKICPLSDKYKLQTTLQNRCAIEDYSKNAKDCKDCQYGKGLQLEREKAEIKLKIAQMRRDLERKRKVEEIKRELMKKQGVPYF